LRAGLAFTLDRSCFFSSEKYCTLNSGKQIHQHERASVVAAHKCVSEYGAMNCERIVGRSKPMRDMRYIGEFDRDIARTGSLGDAGTSAIALLQRCIASHGRSRLRSVILRLI
jgi:hypothetical protein